MGRMRAGRAETRLFSVAAAVIGLHAAADAFIAPEPGTAWTDHLLRGSSSLAIVATAALLYPRLRTGARAALAAVLGALSLEGAALAILDARAVGARGEDWTGFLLAPVGLALCGLAAALLWRSRTPGRLRYLRRAGILLGGVLAIYWLVLPLALAILATHRPRTTVEPADLGRPYEQVDAGVAWLQRRPDVSSGRVGGIGFSVGGEMMLEAAASNAGLRAVVSEGAGERSIRESLIRGPRGWFALPAAAAQTAALAVLSGVGPPPSLTDVIPRIAPRPIFLIYAGHGTGGEELQPQYYEAARQPKTMWKIPEAGHTGGLSARPEEYERRVVGFFDRTLFLRRQDPS